MRKGRRRRPAYESSAEDWQDESDESPDGTYPCPHCGAAVPEMGMANFSFNKPAGACPTCTGLGVVRQPIVSRLVDESKSIPEHAVDGWIEFHGTSLQPDPARTRASILVSSSTRPKPSKITRPSSATCFLYGTESPQFRRHFPNVKPPATNAQGRFEGVVTNLQRRYDEHATNAAYLEKLDHLFTTQPCLDCEGTRLRPESRAVTVAGESIITISQLPLNDLDAWLKSLPPHFTAEEMLIARPILDDLYERVGRLLEVGVGYLTLERSSPTLSAGEAQRLRLAALLGSGLTGVLYVLDEPTIGLHPRDTQRLINVLRRLRDLGNTVLVVEHDLELIKAADYLVDVGPGAGKHGGQIVAAGTPAEVAKTKESLTGAFIAETHERADSRTPPRTESQSADHSRSAPVQPAKPDGADPAWAAGGGDGRLRLGQVFADLRHPRRCRSPTPERRERVARRARLDHAAGSTSTRSSPSTRRTSGASRARTPPPTPTHSRPSARRLPPRPKPKKTK